jgi:exo-beta-1,3-glucanase (GH17 family)
MLSLLREAADVKPRFLVRPNFRDLGTLLVLVSLSIACGGGQPASNQTTSPPPAVPLFASGGVNYGPFRDGQSPFTVCPTLGDIVSDVQGVLAQIAAEIRTYDVVNCQIGQNIIAAVTGSPLKLALGMWIGSDAAANESQMAELQTLVTTGLPSNVTSVVVGSEALLRGDVSLVQLVAYINQVRTIVPSKVPVTTAEPWYIWVGMDGRYPDLTSLVQAVDFLFVNIHPYWELTCADQATTSLFNELGAVTSMYPSVAVKISETGWPSDGETQGCAVPSLSNEQQFVQSFYCEAQKTGVDFYLFEATDEEWKSLPYPGVPAPLQEESHWGLYDSSRNPKLEATVFSCSL